MSSETKRRIEYALLPHQTDFVNAPERYVLESGGVGSGKTYSIVLKTLSLIIHNPGIFILLGAQTFPLLRDTTMREFLNVVPPEMITGYNKATSHFTFWNGAEVIFRPFDDPTKLKSLNLGACGIEEMTDVSEDIFKMVRTRMRQPAMPGVVFGATNPGTFGNWVYRNFIEKPVPNSRVIYSRTTDNDYLPDAYLADLEHMKESNPEYYRRMVEGMWGQLEGLVYAFPLDSRLASTPETYQRFIGGLDFGFTHPTAMVIFGVIDEKYYQVDEIYRHKMTSGDIINAIREKIQVYPMDVIYCDAARPEIIEDMRRAGIPAQAAVKDVFDGIMWVKTLIGSRRLYVHQACMFTLREYDSYIWDRKNEVKEVPVKVNDDCMDATRYALYSDMKRNLGEVAEPEIDISQFGL